MKKTKYIMLAALLLVPATVLGQTVRKDTVMVKSPYADLRGIRCVQTVPYKTIDGVKQVDGTLTIEGKDSWDAGQHDDSQTYWEQRTYVGGMLNGAFRQKYTHNGYGRAGGRYKIDRKFTADGNFKNGIPTGLWKLSLTALYNDDGTKEMTKLTETVTFKEGKAVTIVDHAGKRIDIDYKGLASGTGDIKGGPKTTTAVTLKNGVATNIYVDIDGEQHLTGEKEKKMVEQVLSGNGDIFTLHDKGYTIEWQERFLAQWARYAEHIDRYARVGAFAMRFRVPKYTIRIGILKEIDTIAADKGLEYYDQRPKEYDRLMTEGYYPTRYGNRYLNSRSAKLVREQWKRDQEKVIAQNLQSNARHEAVAPISPVLGCRIKSVNWRPYEGYTAVCQIDKQAPDSIGFSTWQLSLSVDTSGSILLGRLNHASYQRIANIWDTVANRERQLANHYSEIMSHSHTMPVLMRHWFEEYGRYFADAMDDRTNKAAVRLSDLDRIDSLQYQFAHNYDLLYRIDTLQAAMEQYKIYTKLWTLYDKFRRESDIEWNDDSARLQRYADTLSKYLRLLKESETYTLERNANIYKVKTLEGVFDL